MEKMKNVWLWPCMLWCDKTGEETNPIWFEITLRILQLHILKSPEWHQGSIFRAKAEVRAMRITSLSSAPACKLSMPGDTQVLGAVCSIPWPIPPMLPFVPLSMWSLRAQACVESRELACSVRLRRIGLAEPPFLVSASVALHALQEAFCRLVENWLKTVNYGSCGAQMNRLNCSFSVFYHPDMGQEFWATMPYGIAILSSCFPPLCTILDPKFVSTNGI